MKSKLKLSLLLITLIMLFIIPKAFADEDVMINDLSQLPNLVDTLSDAKRVAFMQQNFDHVPWEIEDYISKSVTIYGWGNTLLEYFATKAGYEYIPALGTLNPKNASDYQYIFNFSDDGTKILGVKAYNMKEIVIPEGVKFVQFAPMINKNDTEFEPDPDYLEILSGVEKVTFNTQNPVFIEDYKDLTGLKELYAYEGLGLENYPKFKSLGNVGLYYDDFEYEIIFDEETQEDYALIKGIAKEQGNDTLEFPEEIEGCPVRKIASNFDAKAITIREFKKIIIPETIDEIGYVYDEEYANSYPFINIRKYNSDMFFYGNSITLTRSIGMTFLGINSLDLMPKRLYCHNYSELPDEYPDYTWYYIEDIVEEPDDPGEVEYLTEDAKEKTVTVSMYGQEIQVIPTTTDDDVSVESFIESNIIVPDGGRVEIMDMSGNILSDGDSVGTKSILTIYDENNTPLIYYAIAVKGDISGDGALALFDAFKILIENLTGKDLDPIDIIARDFNDDGSVTLFDAFKFLIKSLQS